MKCPNSAYLPTIYYSPSGWGGCCEHSEFNEAHWGLDQAKIHTNCFECFPPPHISVPHCKTCHCYTKSWQTIQQEKEALRALCPVPQLALNHWAKVRQTKWKSLPWLYSDQLCLRLGIPWHQISRDFLGWFSKVEWAYDGESGSGDGLTYGSQWKVESFKLTRDFKTRLRYLQGTPLAKGFRKWVGIK